MRLTHGSHAASHAACGAGAGYPGGFHSVELFPPTPVFRFCNFDNNA